MASLALAPAQTPEPKRYLDDVKYLASPDLQGRGAGTKGLERAAHYIENRFKQLHLEPAGASGSYQQALQVTTGAKTGKGNHLEAVNSRRATPLHLNDDYTPLSFSSNGEAHGPVVFAGFGITAPEFKYDDYQHLDVKDKIVLVLRHEPKGFRKDATESRRAYTHHASLVSKAINARNHGARALILVNGALDAKQPDTLIRFGSVAGPENSGIIVAQIKNAIADEWLKTSNRSLSALQTEINDKSEPASFALPEPFQVKIKVDIVREQATVRNIAGYLPGRSKEYLIIGAHYDHLGLGNESSLAPSQIGQVHPGADDNASGTAAVLELARLFANRRNELTRGVLFITFAAEEIGLLGSAYWVNHPTRPLEDAVAMINMDMIGRLNNSKLYIGGTGTGTTFESMLKAIGAKYDFKIDFSQDGYSSSDHTSFVAKSIPVLFFFSGLHGDYHKPSDTWDKIDAAASAKVVNLVGDVANGLIADDKRPQFVKVDVNPHSGTAVSSGGGGYGPYFGSVPDFAPIEKGVKFSDVRAGSPAGKAGLKAGDILIAFGDKPINNLYDFTFALRNSKVGDVVTVKFLRDGKEQTTQVTLEARR